MEAPRFSWSYEQCEEYPKQTAYQIIVSRRDLVSCIVWDSGIINCSDATNIAYAGKPLKTAECYAYQIKAWLSNQTMVESDVATFSSLYLRTKRAELKSIKFICNT